MNQRLPWAREPDLLLPPVALTYNTAGCISFETFLALFTIGSSDSISRFEMGDILEAFGFYILGCRCVCYLIALKNVIIAIGF